MRRFVMKRKNVLVIVFTLLFSFAFSILSMAGVWRHDTIGGWWYQYDDGSYPSNVIRKIDNKHYGFDAKGYMYSNIWILGESGSWYFAGVDGALVKNDWVGDYYLGSDGKMLTDAWIDGYYVGSDGKWIPGMSKEKTTSSEYDLFKSAQAAQLDTETQSTASGTSAGKRSSKFLPNWIYGEYNNVGLDTMFNERYYVGLRITKAEGNYKAYDALATFGLSSMTGTGYDLYDDDDPNGDLLKLIYTTNDQIWGISDVTGDEYLVTYDGVDTIRIYWRDTTWYDGDYDNVLKKHYLELKKIKDYYPDEYGGVG